MLWVYSQSSSWVICTQNDHPKVQEWDFSPQILHVETQIPCRLGWLEIFVLEHQLGQWCNEMPSALVNAHSIQSVRSRALPASPPGLPQALQTPQRRGLATNTPSDFAEKKERKKKKNNPEDILIVNLQL